MAILFLEMGISVRREGLENHLMLAPPGHEDVQMDMSERQLNVSLEFTVEVRIICFHGM